MRVNSIYHVKKVGQLFRKIPVIDFFRQYSAEMHQAILEKLPEAVTGLVDAAQRNIGYITCIHIGIVDQLLTIVESGNRLMAGIAQIGEGNG